MERCSIEMCEAIQGMMKKAADRERITTKLNDIQNLMQKMIVRN